MENFSPFVLPFVLGAFALLGICIYKYVRWVRQFDRAQKKTLYKNIFSVKFIPALWEMFTECLLHLRITKKNWRLGYMHRSIAFGWFLLILVGAIESRLGTKEHFHFWVAIFYRYFHHTPPVNGTEVFFTNLMDLLLLYVLSGVCLALVKKIRSSLLGMQRATKHSLMDKAIRYSLWGIFPLRLLSESVTACIYGNGGFLTQSIGNLFSIPAAQFLELPFWSLYSIDLCVFFVLLPFTRYMHIFTEIFLIYFRRLGVQEHTRMTGFTKFELSSCSRCGMCIDHCPLYKDLDIPEVQSVYLLRNLRNLEYHKDIVTAAKNCLMCNRCVEDCPVNIDLMNIRRIARDKGKIDMPDSYSYLKNVNSFNAIGRVAYFGGCMSHLTPGITQAMETIFQAAGQDYWYMDEQGTICCGRPLLQQGFNSQASELRRKNTELIRQSGATALITSCPICYKSFKDEYQLSIPVYHHTEYLKMLIDSGKLKVKKGDLKVTYHDPCELGRGQHIYEQPRQVLSAVATLLNISDEKENSLCCGMNLGNTVLSLEQQTVIRDNTLACLSEPNPDIIATACPMCKKAFVHGTGANVKDIAEIVANQIEK
ncbi:MAG: (Fe-S)-binding protein [Bacteroidales bacterium]|nr:(Fe-S)-binding protein [Bacteroidales bacterium]